MCLIIMIIIIIIIIIIIPLEVGPVNFKSSYLGERCKLPSGVWGGTPAEIEFGAF